MSTGMLSTCEQSKDDDKASCSCRSAPESYPQSKSTKDVQIYSVIDLNGYDTDDTAPSTDESSVLSTTSSVSSMSSLDVDIEDECIDDFKQVTATVKLPHIDKVLPIVRDVPEVPEVIDALHHMSDLVRTLDLSAVEIYEELQVSEVKLSPLLPPLAHVDGGALATTSDRHEYFWCYRQYTDEEHTQLPRLKVVHSFPTRVYDRPTRRGTQVLVGMGL